MLFKRLLCVFTLAVPAALLLLGGGTARAQATTTVPGRLPGEFAVSPSGAATYRIPIEVPPGVGGMQPELALAYNSQAGNGIMGMGWSIEGLSAITRCPRTMATDGVRGGVNLNTEDRFCLDGQRLINVVGNYGAAGSEYRTELDSFARIVAVGAAGGNAANGPESFTVKTKAGLSLSFGATADARIEVQGRAVVRLWALNRMSDAKGNVIDFAYTEDNANGQFLLDTVSYAGRSVKFTYEDRPDKFRGYQAGSRIAQTWRLKEVETRIGDRQVFRTSVGYQPTGLVGRTLVDKVTQCSGSIDSCLSGVEFAWTNASPKLGMAATQSQVSNEFRPAAGWFSTGIHDRVWMVDINGDGLSDILGATDSGLYWQHNTGSGFGATQSQADNQFRPGWGWFSTGIHNRVWVADLNGDGLPDILGATDSGLYWQLNTGNGFGPTKSQTDNEFRPVWGWFSTAVQSRVWLSDINGDGLPDLLGATDTGLYWQLNTGQGFGPVQSQRDNEFRPGWGWFSSDIQRRVWLTDVNGDGLPDILGTTDTGLYWQLNTGNGFGAVQSQRDTEFRPGWGWFSAGIHSRVWVSDINGDGLPDILGATDSGLYWQLNTGSGFGPTQSQTDNQFRPGWGWFSVGIHDRVWLTDMDGDGLPDILGATDTGLYWQLNTGSGFGPTQSQADNQFRPGSGWFSVGIHNRVWLTDVNGDGLPDIMGATDSGLYWQIAMGSEGGKTLLSSVKQGTVSTNVSFRTLVEAGVPMEPSSYPRASVQTSMFVVSTVSRPNGVGGMNKTSYRYAGLKAEQASAQHPGSGRGLLGFRWIKSLEEATGLESTTEYSQSWPTTGLVTRSETRLSGAGNGGLLKQTLHTYGCHQSHAAAGSAAPTSATAPCGPWAPGKVYFPYLHTSTEDSWDLNGAALPRLSTTHTYAGYPEESSATPRQFGDPTQIQVDIHHGGVLQHRKTTLNDYQPAKTGAGQWQLARLKRASVTSTQY